MSEQNLDLVVEDTLAELYGPRGAGPGPSSTLAPSGRVLRAEAAYGGSGIGARVMLPRAGVRFGSVDPRLDPRPRLSSWARVRPKSR